MGLWTYVNKDGTTGYGIRYWVNRREVRERIGPSKRQAELVLAKRKTEIREKKFGLHRDATPRPFSTAFRQWLDTYAKNETKASTYALYKTAYEAHLLPFFGDLDIREISREQVKRFTYEKLNAGLSRSAVKNYLAPLSVMCTQAMEDGLLERNPCLGVLRTSRKDRGEQQAKVDFFTRAELTRLLQTCRASVPAHYPLVLLLARTGLRIGEAVVLQWGDLDFHGRFILVQRNYVDGKITTTKASRIRRVDMSQQLTETLSTLQVARKAETLQRGWREFPPWLFLTAVGTHLDPDNFRKRAWHDLLKKAQLRQTGLHTLRHTFASLLIQQGAPLKYVQEQMGHHSIRVTVDTYGHLIPGGNKAEIDKLDDAPAAPSRIPRVKK